MNKEHEKIKKKKKKAATMKKAKEPNERSMIEGYRGRQSDKVKAFALLTQYRSKTSNIKL